MDERISVGRERDGEASGHQLTSERAAVGRGADLGVVPRWVVLDVLRAVRSGHVPLVDDESL